MAARAPPGRRKAGDGTSKARQSADRPLRQLQDEDASSIHPYASFPPASTDIAFGPASSLSPLSPSHLSPPPLAPDFVPTAPARSIWFIYGVSLSGMLIAGTAYAYSAWSPDLKDRLSLSQSQVELIGYCGNFPGLVQPFVGVLINRYHPAVTAVLAAGFLLTGYLLMAAAVWTDSWLTSAAVMAAANAAVVVGITHIYTVVLAVNVVNLPPHRLGLGISGCVTLYGLSASVFSLLYVYALHNSLTAYFLLSGLLTSAVCLLNAAVLRKVPRAGATLSVTSAPPSDSPSAASLQLLPPVSPQPSSRSSSSPSSLSSISFSSSTSFSSAANAGAYCMPDAVAAAFHSSRPPSPVPLAASSPPSSSSSSLDPRLTDGSFISVFLVLLHLLRLPLFYLYFAVIFLVGGCGYLIINNTGNVLQSLNGGQQDHELTFACILVLSLGNGIGRMLMAFSDVVPIRAGWFAVMSEWLLTAGFTGVAYGSVWAITPILTAQSFSPALFSISWGFVASAPSLASLAFNAVVGALYDARADAEHSCVGRQCWTGSWLLGMGASAVGLVLSLCMLQWTEVGGRDTAPAPATHADSAETGKEAAETPATS